MKTRYVRIGRVSFLVFVCASWAARALFCQDDKAQRPLYVEQREETWLPDGVHDEHIVRITRTSHGVLTEHPLHDQANRTSHTGHYFFYLEDSQVGKLFAGETYLGAAWWGPVDRRGGAETLVDRYRGCALLKNPEVATKDGGVANGYRVVRVMRTDKTERHTVWLAPELDCFPLRMQVTEEDGWVRLRVETISIKFLPDDTQLSLPAGVRVVSPQRYCDLYKEMYKQDYMPAGTCARNELRYSAVAEPKQ